MSEIQDQVCDVSVSECERVRKGWLKMWECVCVRCVSVAEQGVGVLVTERVCDSQVPATAPGG